MIFCVSVLHGKSFFLERNETNGKILTSCGLVFERFRFWGVCFLSGLVSESGSSFKTMPL